MVMYGAGPNMDSQNGMTYSGHCSIQIIGTVRIRISVYGNRYDAYAGFYRNVRRAF